jgi:hypothetical protein
LLNFNSITLKQNLGEMMSFPINESSVLLVVAAVPTTALIGMMIYLSLSSIFGKDPKTNTTDHSSQ